MAAPAPSDPIYIEVKFSKRDDGGLRAVCDALPNFFLSHSDPDLVMADVGPALQVILGEMLGMPLRVETLQSLDHVVSWVHDVPPAHICEAQRYVGLRQVA